MVSREFRYVHVACALSMTRTKSLATWLNCRACPGETVQPDKSGKAAKEVKEGKRVRLEHRESPVQTGSEERQEWPDSLVKRATEDQQGRRVRKATED